MSFEEEAKQVIATGVSALSIPLVSDEDIELFVSALDRYLVNLDSIQQRFGSEELTEDTVKLLLETHSKLAEKAEGEKSQLLQRMSQLTQRRKVLRSYSQKLPTRISITGRREG
jgi:hypothetical protein